jgi:membrane protease YdiL (CAAX protease family)
MIAVEEARREGWGTGAAAAGLAGAGAAVLLARPWLLSLGAGWWALAALYAGLAASSLAVPAPARSLPVAMPASVALAVGLAAVALAGPISGAAPPLPDGVVALALSLGAAVAEEAFFRRFLYGRLLGYGVPAAITLSALAFALVHVAAYGGAVFWVDLGAGLLFGWQRWASGRWGVPAATHAVANLLAVLR